MTQKAPGKFYRSGISLIELFQQFPNDQVAEEWFEVQRWGKVGKPTHCPKCGCSGRLKKYDNRKTSPYHCADCRSYFSVRTNTVMSHSAIPLQKWVIGIYLWSTSLKGVSSMKLHRDLNITQKSAWFMAQRLREAWKQGDFNMEGTVEVDETYIGGLEKNKHNKDKLKAGRGTVGKTAVVGVKERDTNKIKAKVVSNTKKETLQDFIADNVSDEATVCTDENKSYKGLKNHKTVNHSVSEYVTGMAHTNGIESFWSLLKKGYHGTFHHFSPKHMERYVNEFTARYNMRGSDTIVMMADTVGMMVGKRLTYRELVSGD
ncbi:MAG: IS1595 family transposase [Paracoccaceae bacterium]|nr:IS1595 family transposase [Paracoccaceae bacterium]MDE2916535.1 IS1595 family transposase [Paracoccaceae bacterium]